jgi:hypothetical protein
MRRYPLVDLLREVDVSMDVILHDSSDNLYESRAAQWETVMVENGFEIIKRFLAGFIMRCCLRFQPV